MADSVASAPASLSDKPSSTDPDSTGIEAVTPVPRVSLPKPSRRNRWGMNPEDRARVMEACLLLERTGWKLNFAWMMTMAGLVAIMGLAANSAAVVIGAMLIAPLMTPVLGIAASIAMVLREAIIRSIITVVLATAGVVGLGYIFSFLLPGDHMQSSEILARTSPDIKDLGVAIAAGLAGSYATARPDMSSSLPGVAVAVALVPPLAVMGFTLQAGAWRFALGATLLYVTNLACIVTMSTIVFISTGFVPMERLAATRGRVILGSAIAMGLVGLVAIPLTVSSIRSSATANKIDAVRTEIVRWNNNSNTIENWEYFGNFTKIAVDLEGSNEPQDTQALETALEAALGSDVELDVRWTQVQRKSIGSDSIVYDINKIDDVISEWLTSTTGAADWAAEPVLDNDDLLTVTVTSTEAPPPVLTLTDLLEENFGASPATEIVWVPRAVEQLQQLESQAAAWASERGVRAEEVHQFQSDTGATIIDVDLVGESVPEIDSLKAELRAIAGADADVRVWFTQRVRVLPVTSTPVPTVEPTPVPTVAPTEEPTPSILFGQPLEPGDG